MLCRSIVFLLLFISFGIDVSAQTFSPKIVPGQYIVQLKNASDINQMAGKYSSSRSKKANYKQLSKALNIWLLYTDTAKNTSAYYLDKLKQEPGILLAQYNHHISLREKIPSDSLFSAQWNLLNNGSFPNSKSGADISISKAWDITTGGITALGDTIVVAVIDNGFDLEHEDLDFWINRNEIPGNKIDDDNNGYIDDYRGWNVFNQSDSLPSRYHGTEVCGILGARGNNTKGICGINWNVKILAVAGSSETEADVVTAYSYIYALRIQYNDTKKGAFIVCTNSSFGVDYGRAEDFPIWCEMYNSLGKLGILNVVSVANLNIDADTEADMPTSCSSPYMISVTNSTAKDEKDSIAAFGKNNVDIAAPGIDIFTTHPTGYSRVSGTSFSAPQVSGTIALLFSHPCKDLISQYFKYPAQTALNIKDILLRNADPLPAFENNTVSGGRLNAYKAISAIDAYCADANKSVSLLQLYPNPASKKIFLQIKKNSISATQIVLINMLGQIVLREDMPAQETGIISKEINVENLSAGLYLVNVITDREIINSSPVIISK